METMNYKIGRMIFTQRELTWGQDKALIELFKGAYDRFRDDDNIEFRVKEFFNLLLEKDLIRDFFKIILIPRRNLRYWLSRLRRREVSLKAENLSNSQMEEIIVDFFFLNQKLMTKLSTLGGSLSLIAQTIQAMNGKMKASSSTGSASAELKNA